jgi:hypothetical protein
MTTRDDFTEEEWARLGRAPLVAGMAITLADPGGPIEALKESRAALKTVQEAAEHDSHGDFVRAVAADVTERARRRQNPLAGFRPTGPQAGEAILDELRAVNQLLVAKATPEDAAAFRWWLREAAQRTAKAAKEGGFLGFNAELVSEREQQMLERLGEIFSDEADGEAGDEVDGEACGEADGERPARGS